MSYVSVDKGDLSFPNRDISEDEKNLPQYSLEYVKAIYNRYLNDKCGVRYNDASEFDLRRSYGRGSQPVEIYKQFLNGDDGVPIIGSSNVAPIEQKGRKGWDNIQWDIVSPLPRIKTIIKGYLDQFGKDVFVDTIDPISGQDQESIKWRAYAMAQSFDFIKEYHLKAGLPMEELDFKPANTTELNMYEAMGGFKLNHARAMEKLTRHTGEISKIDDDLQDRFADDAMDLGLIACKVELDKETNKYKYVYVDPKDLVIQFVQSNDYTRSEYAGLRKPWTISELKQYLPDKEESFFKNLAIDYNGKGQNGSVSDWDNFSKLNSNGSYNYDTFIVEVFDAEWIDYEARRHLIGNTDRGRKFVKKIKLTTNVGDNDRAKDIRTNMRKLRTAKWIVGTDVVFDEGLGNMQDRPMLSTVMHNYKLIVLRDKPITESLVPIADDLALVWYKYQNDRALAVSAGYSIDVGMMQNIGEGGDKFGFLEVLEKWRKSGWLMHTQSLSGKYEGGKTDPVSPIPSIMPDVINEAMMAWEFALRRIEDITGLNVVMLGGTTNPQAAVGTTQMSSQASVHILKPMIDAIGTMKEELSATLIRRLQLAFKARKDIADAYVSIVGQSDIDALIVAEKTAAQYGQSFEARPSEEAKQDVLQGALAAMTTRREGGAGLSLAQYTYVVNQVRGKGNLKELGALIDFLISKSEAQIQAEKDKNMQMQGQINQQNAQAAAQGQAQIQQGKTQGELQLAKMKGTMEMKNTLVKEHPDLFRTDAQLLAARQSVGGQGMGGGQGQQGQQNMNEDQEWQIEE